MRVTSLHFPQSLIKAISLPTDSTIDILKKLVLLLGNLGGYFFSFVLALLYIYYRLHIPTVLAFVYLFAITIVYIYYL
jgi:hypothetical protein